MRDILPEYYLPSSAEFKKLWQDATFVLDANVLLDFYRYSPSTSKQLFDIITRLGDRVWVPYQAALEYQRNRLSVISSQLDPYDRLGEKWESSYRELVNSLNKYADSDALLKPVADALAKAKGTLETTKKKHSKVVPADELHAKITALLKGKVGNPYDQKQLQEHRKAAESRYSDLLPPGYRDDKKNGPDKYGDVLVWFQTIDRAATIKKPIILVTGDLKADWWWEDKGKKIGPRPELRREMREKSGVEFYMYAPERFMENAREYLGSTVTDEAIAEAREVQEKTEVRGLPDRRSQPLNPWATGGMQFTSQGVPLWSNGSLMALGYNPYDLSRHIPGSYDPSRAYIYDPTRPNFGVAGSTAFVPIASNVLGAYLDPNSIQGPLPTERSGDTVPFFTQFADSEGKTISAKVEWTVSGDGRSLSSIRFEGGDTIRHVSPAPANWMSLSEEEWKALYKAAQ